MSDWRTRLKIYIAEHDIKITHLSEQLGFNRDYIGRLLKPNSNPQLSNLEKICAAMGVSFVYIYSGNQKDNVLEELIDKVNSYDDTELQELQKFLEENPLLGAPK